MFWSLRFVLCVFLLRQPIDVKAARLKAISSAHRGDYELLLRDNIQPDLVFNRICRLFCPLKTNLGLLLSRNNNP